MARGEVFTARIERIVAGGAGIARPAGKSVFIELTAPGDMVRFQISKEHKTWARAELLEIQEPSPLRVTPPCPLYGHCGGCSLQHLSYEAQIQAKTAILQDALIRIGGFNPPALPAIRIRTCAPFEYRSRFQFHKQTDAAECGFMGRKSSRFVAIGDCPVAEAGIRKALKEGTLKTPDKKRFTVYSHKNTFLVEGKAEKGHVSILDKNLAMDVKVFFQSNAAMLELLISDLKEAASCANKELPLADIYCGVGTFAAFLGEEFPAIDLVEENKSALALARENVRGKNVNYYADKDTAWAKTLDKRQNETWGFMVLDPPREGLSGSFAKWLAENGPCLAAYVSCDPATLARDSRILMEGGYTLKELSLYDFYPQTAHIESLSLFVREGKPHAR